MATDLKVTPLDPPLLYETHVSFRYMVDVGGITVGAFTECTLPVIEIDTEEIKEGGLNSRTHLLPGRRKAARLTLKNGLGKNGLVDWCREMMQEKFTPKTIDVVLKDARLDKPICTWHIETAYPVKWTAPQFQADSNAVAIQTIEFACGEVTVEIGEAIVD